jgi:hypothetical protein
VRELGYTVVALGSDGGSVQAGAQDEHEAAATELTTFADRVAIDGSIRPHR